MSDVRIAARPRRNPDEERAYRKRYLAAALRVLADHDCHDGAGGHVTVRDPEADAFWINPFGVNFAHVRVSDLLLVDRDGAVQQGDGRVNPAGFTIHSAVHAHRPDVVAAAHTHAAHGSAFSCLGQMLLPITQDACAFYEDHAEYTGFSGVVLEADEGKAVASALGSYKAVIMRNHGLLTVGGSVAEAVWWFLAMNRACRVQMIAQAAGTPILIPHEVAVQTRETMGSPEIGRLNFRPLFADVIHRHPDLME